MKQAIIINDSLNLPRGKLAAQVAHASMSSFLEASSSQQKGWIEIGMPKIVLSATSENEVIEFHRKALDENLPTSLIKDAGRTVVVPGTITCVGIGPAPEADINKITGQLKRVK